MRAQGTRVRQDSDRQRARPPVAPTTGAQRLMTLQRMAGNAAVVRAMSEQRHEHDANCGHGVASVQRVVDAEVVGEAKQELGIERDIKIVEVPDGVKAGVPFGRYPQGHVVGLGEEERNDKSVLTLFGLAGDADAEAMTAAEIVAAYGGGGYVPGHDLILINSTPDEGYTFTQTVQHEIGHIRQTEDGHDIATGGGGRALVEYHNVLVNENRLTGGLRTIYNRADDQPPLPVVRSRSRKEHPKVDTDPWSELERHVAAHDDQTQKNLLRLITEELADPKYDVEEKEGEGPVREKIKKRVGRMYFNRLYDTG
ncbi:hypothetical protein ABZ471_02650 [Streptomyces sp. NPDC005728]|uniref:hypothetical protein n=1 Tax=Streptomyces sp. NPDC005728 TaxID=3157054 RepID=UPI0033FD3579